jgi:hypothetical protein
MAPHPYFGGAFVGMTSMDLPSHENGAVHFNGKPQNLQADVDGWSFGLGIGKDLDSGWRVGAFGRWFDGDGAASGPFALAGGEPFQRGPISGGTPPGFLDVIVGIAGGPFVGTQTLQTDVQEGAGTIAVGHSLFDMVRGDILVIYTYNSTDYRHQTDIGGERYRTNTSFASNGVEVAGRLSLDTAIMDGVTFGVGGSAGYGYRHAHMNASQQYLFTPISALSHGDSEWGFVGRADANLSYWFNDRLSLGLTANYVSDSTVPQYVEPNYVTHTAATVGFTTQSSTTYGLRVVTRW